MLAVSGYLRLVTWHKNSVRVKFFRSQLSPTWWTSMSWTDLLDLIARIGQCLPWGMPMCEMFLRLLWLVNPIGSPNHFSSTREATSSESFHQLRFFKIDASAVLENQVDSWQFLHDKRSFVEGASKIELHYFNRVLFFHYRNDFPNLVVLLSLHNSSADRAQLKTAFIFHFNFLAWTKLDQLTTFGESNILFECLLCRHALPWDHETLLLTCLVVWSTPRVVVATLTHSVAVLSYSSYFSIPFIKALLRWYSYLSGQVHQWSKHMSSPIISHV